MLATGHETAQSDLVKPARTTKVADHRKGTTTCAGRGRHRGVDHRPRRAGAGYPPSAGTLRRGASAAYLSGTCEHPRHDSSSLSLPLLRPWCSCYTPRPGTPRAGTAFPGPRGRAARQADPRLGHGGRRRRRHRRTRGPPGRRRTRRRIGAMDNDRCRAGSRRTVQPRGPHGLGRHGDGVGRPGRRRLSVLRPVEHGASVGQSRGGAPATAGSANDRIRLLTIPKAGKAEPAAAVRSRPGLAGR
ncbi:MAG: hypothetical protein MZV63_23615 [Marinilabiliales bacterium]|nr:hypothetical protein [Marinilabiliales bacterium]